MTGTRGIGNPLLSKARVFRQPRGMMSAEKLAISAGMDAAPPAGISDPARALWLVKSGDWHAAHDLAQGIPGSAGAWIHAHLHRAEGDAGNAAYWYARAGKPVPPAAMPLNAEWQEIAAALA